MKHAIVTLAIGQPNQKMLTLVKPFFEAYSKKVGAEFIIIDRESINGYACHLEKFQIYGLLEKYSRIAYFDVDIIIRPDTPNVFEIVPEDSVGCIYDNVSNTKSESNRKKEIVNSQKGLGDIGWEEGYINSGVIILSEQHKTVFTNPELRNEFESGFKDQTLINYNINKYKHNVFCLDKKFNGMEINGFSSRNINPKSKNVGRNKTSAYCMHFANEGNKLVQMYQTASNICGSDIDEELKNQVKQRLNSLKPFISRQNARELRMSKRRIDIPSKVKAHAGNKNRYNDSNPLKVPANVAAIESPEKIMMFYDISELGWSMYLAAHLKYLKQKGKRVGIICPKAKEVLYRDSAEIILPIPRLYTDKFRKMMSDGNHLFDPDRNVRIRDQRLISTPFRRAYPKFNMITRYSKFENERVFAPYKHSKSIEEFCYQKFANTPVIIVFPRHRDSKFKCRNIPRSGWINIIRNLCKAYPKACIISIGSISGAYDININESNYHNFVKHSDDETLDMLVCLCNTNQAVATVGNQSGTVKIALLCKTPTYIFGDEEDRHIRHENWSNTSVGFWKAKSTVNGYNIPNFNDMISDIIQFINKHYKGKFNNPLNTSRVSTQKRRKIPPPLSKSKNHKSAILNTVIK